MRLLYSKIFKTVLFGVMPILLISGTSGDWKLNGGSDDDALIASYGEQKVDIPSGWVFREKVEALPDGSLYPTLMLTVPEQSHRSKGFKDLQLVISDRQRANIDNGNYQISGVSSFLEHITHVFGVANYEVWGELPFFATAGNVRINYKEEQQMFGYVHLECQNQNGERIVINGPFVAHKEPE